MKFVHTLLLSASLLSFQVYAMEPDEIVEYVYNPKFTYSSGVFNYNRDGSIFSTSSCPPQKVRNQKALIYNDSPKELKESALYKESSLYKVIPGQDGRKHISNTTTWPHCINTKLKMTFNGSAWGGSATMIGPHHLLTCGHCVYDFDEKIKFQEIFAYPALNGEMAPFEELKVTKAYIFRSWFNKGDPNFDIAVLLLDQSIGEYTGWGGLLSTSDTELSLEEVHITGYPGDKGFKYMWGMSHKIKSMTSEKIYYEHDTQGGQSGGAISIKKYGMPFVVGVHTNGCGYEQEYIDSLSRNTSFYSSLTNSGVRLSGRKFTDLILKVMPATYVLNNNKDSLFIAPNPIPQMKALNLRERQSNMDDCMSIIKKYSLPIEQLEMLREFDINEVENIGLLLFNIKQNLEKNKLSGPEATRLWNIAYPPGNRGVSAQSPAVKQYDTYIKEVRLLTRIIKEDMAEYQELTGRMHPGWEPWIGNKISSDSTTKIRLSPHQRREAIFTIRGAMIDDCINLYNQLKNSNLTFGELEKLLVKVSDLYNTRKEKAANLGVIDIKGKNVSDHFALSAPTLKEWLSYGINHHKRNMKWNAQSGNIDHINEVKNDILYSMELYKTVYGISHPRWNEFSKM